MNEPNSPRPAPQTRRTFITSTSSAVFGGAILGGLVTSRRAYSQSQSDLIKVALVGCGGRGRGAAAQALSTPGNVKLVAVADAFQNSLESGLNSVKNAMKDRPERIDVKDETKFVGLDAYKQAIALADVVVLATPPGFRPIHFEEAIRQGKHGFMEKPVAVDGPGIRQVLAAAEEAKKKNLKIGVGLQRHHQKGYIETVQRLHDGAIGEIVAMRAYWNGGPVGPKARRDSLTKAMGRPPTELEYQVRNWYNFVWTCGDHIVEQHIHNHDVINWVKNAYPIRCQGQGGRAWLTGPDSGEIFDHHFVEYEYADGSRMFSQCRQIPGCVGNVSESVVGTKGSCNVSGHTITGENAWRYRGGGTDPYQQEHDDLFEAIRNDKPFNEAEFGAKSTLTAIMGRMATYSGKVVEWKDALNSTLDLMPKQFTWDGTPPVLPGEDGIYAWPIPGKTVAL
jgi:myo-inositol 2-dehydrogenase / D-chiro-inositol 1-dehydrogenase